MSKIRVKDIAKLAGVSPATVSNAMGGRGGVSQEVAARVQQIAAQMGYEPPKLHAVAERQHIRLVVYKVHGLVLMDTQFFAELIQSVQLECSSAGLDLTITHLSAGQSDLSAQIRQINQEECAGILLLGTEMSEEELHWFLPCRSRLLVLDNLFRHEDVSTIVMNNYDAGFKATKALLASGHTRIHHITSNVSFSNVRYRRKGYEAAMAEAGLPISEDCLWKVTPTLEGAYQDMCRMLEQKKELPTAFFAGNDIMAVGCMRALQDAGYKIPEDVSIIGMDDMALGQVCVPPLSTIRVYRQEMGIAAVRTLLTIAPQMGRCVVKTELSVELVTRQSVCQRDK